MQLLSAQFSIVEHGSKWLCVCHRRSVCGHLQLSCNCVHTRCNSVYVGLLLLLLPGVMKLKNAKFAKDMQPLDENCTCRVCQQHTRSYLHHAIKAQGVAAPAILITYHNVAYMQV